MLEPGNPNDADQDAKGLGWNAYRLTRMLWKFVLIVYHNCYYLVLANGKLYDDGEIGILDAVLKGVDITEGFSPSG